jgi:multimeric flavodoxin WrbA
MRVKIIDCTEKQHKDVEKIVNFISDYLQKNNVNYTKLTLKECRCCTQKKSDEPVKCVLKDDLNDELDNIEAANRYIILADRNNLFSKNKVHEKFSQRLVAYYYWPYGQVQSTLRRVAQAKSSILINYNTTKYFMNHSFYTSKHYMEHTSASIGAKVIDWQAITPKKDIIKSYEKRLIEMIDKLLHSFVQRAS